ncbi:MAG: RIP metalloprotease RseP, partial [Myxococcota bacterium]
MGDIVLWLVAGAVMVGVLVIVHEAGHWLVAKLFGVGTPVFSIGFGPRIFGFRLWDTDFRISVLPVGGYVRMAGADPFGEELMEDEEVAPDEDFMSKPVWQRFLIMLAGPAANLILPFVLFSGVLMLGEPQPDSVIGHVRPGSLAAERGLQEGDRVVGLDDAPIDNWRELSLAMTSVEGPFALTVLRDEQRVTVAFPDWVPDRLGRRLEGVGLSHNSPSSTVGVTDPSSPAWQAGLRSGDHVATVDGEDVYTYNELLKALTPDRPHTLEVERRPPNEDEAVPGLDDLDAERTVRIAPNPAYTAPEGEVYPNPWGVVPISVFVGHVQDESSADAAGVRRGDRLVAIDGSIVRTWEDVLEYVGRTTEGMDVHADPPRAAGCVTTDRKVFGQPLELSLLRDGRPVTLNFSPTVEHETRPDGTVDYRPIMGVSQFSGSYDGGEETVKYYGILQAAGRAGEEGRQVLETTLNSLGNLLTG